MQNLLNDLITIFKKDDRLVADGEVLKNKIQELALANDEKVISSLLSNPKTKENFFIKVGNALVFDKDKFIRFVSNKEFLPDSYTAFKNRIGLTDGDEFISLKKEVVLSWPYKDCVLEGGQTKEEAKRKEIFWNETLAPDDISRLLEPKVLTNIKRIDKNGEKPAKEIKDTDNLIIKGNNLLALHSLKEKFKGKIKLIYIDPPYNTGNDSFGYNDSFNHSTWLTFMKNRLEVAKELLSEDGFIFIQCDDNEQAYLKVLMDEVFKLNFLTTLCVQMSYVSGEKMAHIDKKPPKIKEFIHVYSKNKGTKIKPQYTETEIDKEYNKYIEKNNSQKISDWTISNLQDVLKKLGIKEEDEKEKFMLDNAELIFNRVRNKSDIFKKTLGNKKLTAIKTATGLNKYAWNGREAVFLSDRIITNYLGDKTFQQALGDIWSDIPIVNLYLEGDVELLGGKKPEFLIRRIIDMTTKKNDIVLDFHLGSGTTAAVSHKMGRKYIGIEQLDYGENDCVARLKNVIMGDQSGISHIENWKGGGEFVYCELTKWNETIIDGINKAKTKAEIKKIWNEIKDSGRLSYKINVKSFDANAKEFDDLSIGDQKRFLFEVLDKNQLYVNLSDIDDKEYKVSAEDKKLNKQFYQN